MSNRFRHSLAAEFYYGSLLTSSSIYEAEFLFDFLISLFQFLSLRGSNSIADVCK
jgi:hypothetical protein